MKNQKILIYCVCVVCCVILAYLWPGLLGEPDVLPQIFLDSFWEWTFSFGVAGLLFGLWVADEVIKTESEARRKLLLLSLTLTAACSVIGLVDYYQQGLFW